MNALNCNFDLFHHVRPALALAVFGVPPNVFWLYFTGTVLSIIGLIKIIKNELPQKRGLDKLLPFGRLFFAIPMGIFGTEHFTATAQIMSIVPKWMLLHRFWVYFVGVALIAAALSIILEIQARLAATLLGIMLLLFVGMIHVPNIMAMHGARLFWTLALRETAFSGGAFALAAIQSKRSSSHGQSALVTLSRFLVGIPAIFFGVEQFLHPRIAPGIPLQKITPAWVPGQLFWAYLTGVALIVCGACIVLNVKARTAGIYLGIAVLLTVLFIYLPITVANPSDIGNGLNFVADTLIFSGVGLVLADALSERTGREVRA